MQQLKEIWEMYNLPPLHLRSRIFHTWTGRIMSVVSVAFFTTLLWGFPLVQLLTSIGQLTALMLLLGAVISQFAYWLHSRMICVQCQADKVLCPGCRRTVCPVCGDDKHRILTVAQSDEGEQR